MADRQEEFPFEEFVEALQEEGDIRKSLKNVVKVICQKNTYWTYSAVSTLLQLLKSKEQQPQIKCRSLAVAAILLQTAEYPIVTFFEVYLLPIFLQIAAFKGRKSNQLMSYYFQQHFGVNDSPQTKKYSLQFVERAIELVFFGAKIKPNRTVQTQELKQESGFAKAIVQLKEKGVQQPKIWKYCDNNKIKDFRKRFIDNLRKFAQQSQGWAEFLLVNFLQQVTTGKKQLLQLKQLLFYGESFLTSPVINVCEDQLMQMTQKLDLKRKYLNILNELVRSGDIQTIIMIKNSQFVPAISAHISKVQGHLGIIQGQNIYPEIQCSKQLKKQFYNDFMRCLQTWAKTMPSDYDSEEFSIKSIYQFLKQTKNFKFPENIHLGRYQKQIKQNLQKNKERNDKLVSILQNSPSSRYHSIDNHSLDKTPYSKVSKVLPPTNQMSPIQLQKKLQQAKKQIGRLLLDQPTAEQAMKMLIQFKDGWINYLQTLDFQNADEGHLQNIINAGEKCVQQIQLIIPLNGSLSKGKITYKDFKERVIQSLQFHKDVSMNKSQNNVGKQNQNSMSKSLIKSKLSHLKIGKSQFGKSKLAGRDLLQKMKSKSRFGDKSKMDISKVLMDRSHMIQKSKFTDRSKSKLDKSKLDVSKIDKSKLIPQKNIPIIQPIIQPIKEVDISKKTEKSKSIRQLEPHEVDSEVSVTKSFNQPKKSQKSIKNQMQISNKVKQIQNSKVSSVKNVTKAIISQSQRDIVRGSDDQDQQILMRIADYQVESHQPSKPMSSQRIESIRQKSKGSKLLLRRSQNKSKLQKSGNSSVSSDRNSVSSSRKIKQNSLFKKTSQMQMDKTKKVSEIQSQLLKQDHGNINETIQVNGNVVKEGMLTEKKSRKIQIEQEDNKFNDGGDISSIHSNSILRVFHHSAEKILNITDKGRSQINNSKSLAKQIKKVAVQSQVKKQKQKQENVPRDAEYYQQESSQDIINGPDLIPMRHSYHRQSSVKIKLDDNPQFKAVFANKYQALQSREKDERLLRKDEGLKNIIVRANKKQTNAERKQTGGRLSSYDRKLQSQRFIKDQYQPRVSAGISKYNSSKMIDAQAIETEKNKQIQQLRLKIKELEKESMTMKTKLAAKDNELRSIKSGSMNGSQRGFAQFTTPSQSKYEMTSQGFNRSEKNSLRGSSVSKKGQLTNFQKQVESSFKQYLQKIKGSTFCKSLLKIKCLVHKTDDIQIGCLSQRGQKVMETTLYVTPHRYDLVDFAITVIHDHNLKIKTYPQQIKLISLKKQQKINLTIQVLKLPFCLPQFQINYKANSEYSSNYYRLSLPLAYNKFCQIKAIHPNSQSQRHILYIRTDDFKLNSKVVKLDKIADSFPAFTFIPPTKDKPQTILAANCTYLDSKFNIVMSLHEKSSWIQGFLLQGNNQAMNFLICTFKQILNAAKK